MLERRTIAGDEAANLLSDAIRGGLILDDIELPAHHLERIGTLSIHEMNREDSTRPVRDEQALPPASR